MTSTSLMEQICSSTNLNQALRRVKKNKGCAGVDKLDINATISQLRQASNGKLLRQSLLDGSYQPQPVLGVEIPKPSGGARQLGIPTVLESDCPTGNYFNTVRYL
ncbi:RNA-directed DNA polymerase [Photobacterium damselae subsp. piscicida]|nr:RNA-directed DNA polymerase [Photobacterium damselae subsp. piscicida]